MFILEEEHCLALEADLTPAVIAGEPIEVCASILQRHAGLDLVRGIVDLALKPYRSSLDQGVLFRSGSVSLVNRPDYALDLRYGFQADGDDMAPAGQRGALLVRAADLVIANIGPDPLPYSAYRLAAGEDFGCLSSSARLEALGEAALSPGESRIVRGGRDACSLRKVDGARFLTLSFGPRWPTEWVFDRTSLVPIAQAVAHIDDSQLVTCMEVVRWLGDDAAMEAVTALLDHPAHFVRWKAVQALAALAPEAALARIREALDDPHPSVREAARKTLAEIDPEPIKAVA